MQPTIADRLLTLHDQCERTGGAWSGLGLGALGIVLARDGALNGFQTTRLRWAVGVLNGLVVGIGTPAYWLAKEAAEILAALESDALPPTVRA